MIATNVDNLVEISVQGEIAAPKMPALPAMPHLIDKEGRPTIVPQYGSVVLNVKVGDPAFGWVGDKINPGVSVSSARADVNSALMTLACVGNEAVVVTGQARGARGVVTGKSGRWAEHVICHFPDDVLPKLAVGDRILVRAFGTGLKIDGVPDVVTHSLSPALLQKMSCSVVNEKLHVSVKGVVPPELFGAGLGLSETWTIDVQTTTPELREEHGLDDLRLGDLVALTDSDSSYNHGYRKGGVSIGVVSQTDSVRAGFGPGVTILMTSPHGRIVPVADRSSNIADLLGLR